VWRKPWATGGDYCPSCARICRGHRLGKSKTLWHTKINIFIEIENGVSTWCIPNECLMHLPRRPLVHLTHLFNHCLRLTHFPKPWKEAKFVTFLKRGMDPKFPQNLCTSSLLSATGRLFEKVILDIVQRHIEERGQLNVSLLSVPVTARHLNVSRLRTTSSYILWRVNPLHREMSVPR
jgi:hypothetical protein